MAATQRVEVVEECEAPPAFIWALLEDADNWSAWGPWRESELEREGSPPPSGVGAIRRLRVGRRVLREETTVFEPDREMAYRLLRSRAGDRGDRAGYSGVVARFRHEAGDLSGQVLRGIPIRDYEGRIRLTPVGSKARITWSSSFVGSVPGLGPLVRRSIERNVAEITRRLARAAEVTSSPTDEQPASGDT